ncbi:uncharacterized protein LOC111861760 [Cryptotermes secundus]|uniref:uncharacterized protein LOC111861760 n=1 Tax=Cryptotermes secundus TaxID=105785 RepID=UPI000CD7C300|nr:uncharacterized protein LOC111861760 [Cryptotermes secundus]
MFLWAVYVFVALYCVVDYHFLMGYAHTGPPVSFAERINLSTHGTQFPSKHLGDAGCVVRHVTSEFRLQSPGFPQPYLPDLQCLYVVEAVSENICLIEANFLTFDLGDCTSGDHVIIAGHTLCGNLKGERTFRFSPPRSLIQFRSGSMAGRKGFDIAIRQIPCPSVSAPNRECSCEFSSHNFILHSPGYPGPYPSDTHCQSVIRAVTSSPQQSLCQVQFRFVSFHVDTSAGCTKDRLDIGDQDTVCGFVSGVRTYEFLGELRIDFYSDGIGNDGRFLINIVQQGCRILNIPPLELLLPESSPLLPPQQPPTVYPPQQPPTVLPLLMPPPVLPQPTLASQQPSPLLPPHPPSTFIPSTPTSSPSYLPLCCNKVYSGRELILVSPGFPFSNTNENVDCLYDIRPSSPDVCRLRILFKLFWVGEKDSYSGCSGSFLEIDGHFYCDCIIGLTVISQFDGWGDRRQKLLRYRKDSDVKNSGGFLLEVLQEDCSDRSPWSRHDTSNETYRQNEQYYNISNSHNVGIVNSYARHITGQRNFTSPCTESIQDDKTNRSRDIHFNQENNEQNTPDIPCNVSNGTEIADVYSTNHRGHIIYGNASAYSRRNSSAFQESDSALTHNSSAFQESDSALTHNRKNNSKIQHNLSPNIPEENRSDIHNNRDTHKQNVLPQENITMNNSDKQTYKYNLLHKNNSFSDESNVTSGETGNHFSNLMTRKVRQYNHYNIFSIKTNTSSIHGKDMSENFTKYCNDINSKEGKPNVSSVSNMRNFDLGSITNDVAGNRKFTLYRKKSAHTSISQHNSSALTATDSGRTQEVTIRERRNVLYSQYKTDRFWSSGESACPIWGFTQWLLRVKQYFWNKVPQLLCPQLPPSAGQRCQVFSQATGWIQSPGHPQAYPHNLRLCYRLPRLSGFCQIQLFIMDFSLELSENCVKDYMLLGGHWRYCGESLSYTGTVLDMSTAPHMDLILVSDRQYSGRGFRAFYRHVPCNRRDAHPQAGCGQVTDHKYFTLIRSGRVEQDSCVYRIFRNNTDVCSLQLNFSTSELVCGEEYLQIGDQFYCGPLSGRPIEVDFFKPEVTIVYQRTSHRGQGHFIIKGKQLDDCDFGLSEVPLAARVSNSSNQCNTQLSQLRGFVSSHKSQLSSSHPRACGYVILPHEGMCAVRIDFGAFHVPSTAKCKSAFMELQKRKFCNSQLDHSVAVIDFHGSELRIPFYVQGNVGNFQWNFTYTQLPCSETVTRETRKSQNGVQPVGYRP